MLHLLLWIIPDLNFTFPVLINFIFSYSPFCFPGSIILWMEKYQSVLWRIQQYQGISLTVLEGRI